MNTIARLLALCMVLLMLLAGHPDVAIAEREQANGRYDVAVVEHLRVQVPAEAKQAWLQAEQGSWEPWLQQQEGASSWPSPQIPP